MPGGFECYPTGVIEGRASATGEGGPSSSGTTTQGTGDGGLGRRRSGGCSSAPSPSSPLRDPEPRKGSEWWC